MPQPQTKTLLCWQQYRPQWENGMLGQLNWVTLYTMTCQSMGIFLQNAHNKHTRASIHLAVSLLITKSRSCEIGCYNDHVALKSDKHLDSTAAEVPVKSEKDWKSLNMNLTASSVFFFFFLAIFKLRVSKAFLVFLIVAKWCIYASVNLPLLVHIMACCLVSSPAIIWTTAGILLICSFGTNLSEILVKIHIFSFTKIHLKMLSVKQWPSCPSFNVLRYQYA